MKNRLTLSSICLALLCTLSHAQSSEKFTVSRDIPYVEGASEEQYLDFYWPKDPANSTVIFIHGGSLKESGERRNSEIYKNTCLPFVNNGIGCANIDYRLAPTHKWPKMPNDVVSAIQKVKTLIEERSGNPENIFLFGHSSGCTLAASVATNPIFLQAQGLTQDAIKGVIPMGCILDNRNAALLKFEVTDEVRARYMKSDETERFPTPEDWLSANPALYVNAQTPPTLVVIAREERFAPPILEQGARFVRLLKQEYGVDSDLVIVPGKHSSSINDFPKPDNPTFLAIKAFIEKHQTKR